MAAARAPRALLGAYARVTAREPLPALAFSQATGDEEEEAYQPTALSGQECLCVAWEGGDAATYLVLTFEGLLAKVPDAALEAFEPKDGAEGGFDALWPASDADAEPFAVKVAETLQERKYCVVQTLLDEAERREAVALAGSVKELEEYRQETESDYLGRKNCTKAKTLKQDLPESEPEDALERCNHQLTSMGLLLVPLAPDYLGFQPAAHSKAVARMRFAGKAEAERLAPAPLSDDDVEDGLVKRHILFQRTRKVCMVYVVECEGGEIVLYPKDGGEIPLPAMRNRLLLFRHDEMSYSYKPQGESLAVQAWMLGDAPSFQLAQVQAGAQEKLALLGISGPPAPEGARPSIMSMMTRYPGDSADPLQYWTMQIHGTDCVTEWPIMRFDKELYYSPDPGDTIYGKAYTCHGGFLRYDEVTGLDNSHFGISDKEAQSMSMNQRMFLEVGYECLYRGGFRRDTLKGQHIGCYVGDVGSDWHDNTRNFSMWCYEPDFSGTSVSSAVVPARIGYIFGIFGPTMTFDTACSASLYATHHAHMAMLNFDEWDIETKGALVGGVNTVGQTGHVGNCQGNILTHVGRCFTFDEAADGYQRGDGCGALFMKLTDKMKDRDERLACIVGTVSSHDGKSASLTAPSGPAQQVMLRHSLKFCGLQPEEISFTECHGTGTALGDPIEMGAIAAVLLEEREDPLWHTTPKSNISHLESAAGLSGLIKMVGTLYHCAVPPNVHFRKLNPHVDMEGYPRVFQTEVGDCMMNGGYAGCSSFGFGGANARCDVHAVAKSGPLAKTEMVPEKLHFMATTCPLCLTDMAYPCGSAIPTNTVREAHRCSLLRDEFANYEECSQCYKGDFRFGSALQDLDVWNENMQVYMCGTYSGWSGVDEMSHDGEGNYSCYLRLGDTCVEDFHLRTNFGQKLFPSMQGAGSGSPAVAGDDFISRDRNWRVQGLLDGKSSGALYRVSLSWGEIRRVSWEAVEEGAVLKEEEEVAGSDYRHRYFVLGSWDQMAPKELVCVSASRGLYEGSFVIGRTGREEFYFTRDRQARQAIHPARAKAEKGSVPVRGPDEHLNGKHFVVRGQKQESVKVQLSVLNGNITVTAAHGEETTTWRNDAPDAPGSFQVTGSFNGFGLLPMEPESKEVYRCRLDIADYEAVDFQILADEDRDMAYHPDQCTNLSGDALTLGPDSEGGELFWSIVGGEPGASVEIVLDLSQRNARHRVSWRFLNLYQLAK